MRSPASLAATAAALRSGEESLETHLAATRDRVESVEPDVGSPVAEPDRWGRLARAAAALGERHPRPGRRPTLFGTLVGVKDVFHADGFETRAGASVPPAALAGREAPTVTALADAGALVLGKTVTTEFAFLDPGPTRTPTTSDTRRAAPAAARRPRWRPACVRSPSAPRPSARSPVPPPSAASSA